MILLATGLRPLEERMVALMPDKVRTCYHRMALPVAVTQYRPDAVVISPHLEGDEDIISTVRKVRNFGVRVIFLPGSEDDSLTRQIVKQLLPLGVYDFVYDPVTPEKIIYRFNNPGKLGDFEGLVEMDNATVEEITAELEITGDEEDSKEQPEVAEKKGFLALLKKKFSPANLFSGVGRKDVDYLTGCCARKEMERQINRLLAKKKLFSVAMIGFDGFKQINDRYRHPVGDKVLSLFGKFISENLRKQDIPCRYGGEEFAVIFAEISPEEASKVLSRLQQKWAEECIKTRLEVAPTFSAGITLGTGTVSEVIEKADKALYAAKRLGKNRVVVYVPGIEFAGPATGIETVFPEPARQAQEIPADTHSSTSRADSVPDFLRRDVTGRPAVLATEVSGHGTDPVPAATKNGGSGIKLSAVFQENGKDQTGQDTSRVPAVRVLSRDRPQPIQQPVQLLPARQDRNRGKSGVPVRFIMVYSSASGVGKTSVSLALAQFLSESGKVLLVDADTSGSTLTEHFAGILPGRVPFDPVRPDQWDFDLLPVPGVPGQYTSDKVEKVISYLDQYTYVVVDSAPSSLALNMHIKKFLEKADLVFLLCTPEAKSIGAVSRFLKNEATVIPNLKDRTRFVVNRAHPMADRTPDEIGREVGVRIDLVLPEDRKVEEMFVSGKPPKGVAGDFFLSLQEYVKQEIF